MYRASRLSVVVFLLLSTFTILSASASAQQLKIVHIDVGQGDATLIIGPTKALLFDANGSLTQCCRADARTVSLGFVVANPRRDLPADREGLANKQRNGEVSRMPRQDVSQT